MALNTPHYRRSNLGLPCSGVFKRLSLVVLLPQQRSVLYCNMYQCKTTSLSALAISKIIKENRETVRKIKNAVSMNDNATLVSLLDPENNRAGRRAVLSTQEECIIVARLIYAGNCGEQAAQRDRPILGVSCGYFRNRRGRSTR